MMMILLLVMLKADVDKDEAVIEDKSTMSTLASHNK